MVYQHQPSSMLVCYAYCHSFIKFILLLSLEFSIFIVIYPWDPNHSSLENLVYLLFQSYNNHLF